MSGDVTLEILTEPRPIQLSGIEFASLKQGWVTLEVPLLEAWKDSLQWLTPAERERIESPEFYQLLQHHLTRKFLSVKQQL